MQPETLHLAEVGHRFETVDGAGACRAGIGGDRDGRKAGVTVFGHGPGERVHVQAEVRIARDHANALPADADDHRRAGEGAVALVAHINGGALRMACRLARRNECIDTCCRATAGEESASTLRIAEPTPEPVDNDQFQLARTTRDQPGALIDVVTGGHEVGDHAGPGGRRRDKPEAARVVEAHRERENVARNAFDHLVGRSAILGRILQQPVFENLTKLAIPGVFAGQVLNPPHQQFKRPMSEIEHLLARHSQFAGHPGVRFHPGLSPVDPVSVRLTHDWTIHQFRLLPRTCMSAPHATVFPTARRLHERALPPATAPGRTASTRLRAPRTSHRGRSRSRCRPTPSSMIPGPARCGETPLRIVLYPTDREIIVSQAWTIVWIAEAPQADGRYQCNRVTACVKSCNHPAAGPGPEPVIRDPLGNAVTLGSHDPRWTKTRTHTARGRFRTIVTGPGGTPRTGCRPPRNRATVPRGQGPRRNPCQRLPQ